MWLNSPFDPLLQVSLPAPQNTDVPPLQDQLRTRVFRKKRPHFPSLFTFEQPFVDLYFDEVPRVELLPYLLKNRLAKTGFSNAHTGSEITGFGLAQDVVGNGRHLTPPVVFGGVLGHLQTDVHCHILDRF